MGPLANPRRLDAMEVFVNDAKSRGGKIATGGSRHGNQGFFFQPTVITDVPDDAKIMTEEPFGPVAPIVPFKTFDEVVERANSLPFGLAAYAFTASGATGNRHRRRHPVRHGRRQFRRHLDTGDAIRRRQGIGLRLGGRARGPAGVHEHEVHFAGVKPPRLYSREIVTGRPRNAGPQDIRAPRGSGTNAFAQTFASRDDSRFCVFQGGLG